MRLVEDADADAGMSDVGTVAQVLFEPVVVVVVLASLSLSLSDSCPSMCTC